MQIEIIAIIVLLIIIIILLVYFRPKSSNEGSLFTARIDNLQSGLKEDFLLNRTESAAISKENRTELNDTLKGFKLELTQTLALITQQNQQTLQQVIKTIEESNRINRETLASNLKDFIAEQKTKFDELKGGQKDLAGRTIDQLEKISNQTETKLAALVQQDKTDSQLMREALENAFRHFGETFDKNVAAFNNLQKEKFDQLDH
ncbi:MAG TPA: hypothetical protein VK645_03350, partial [Chitinophagaceae bacterium]|nr:hypothetical protein [Chitinophagaceae bacterium]